MKRLIFFALLLGLVGCSDSPQTGVLPSSSSPIMSPSSVRLPAVAGQFYPGNAAQIRSTLQGFLAPLAPQKLSAPQAILVPHAGWSFSGPTAAQAFVETAQRDYDRVIVLSPSHHSFFAGASIPDVDLYRTPLGDIPLDPAISKLRKDEYFSALPEAHTHEHGIEVELPFLQFLQSDFTLVPVVVGSDNSFADLEHIADALRPLVNDTTLVVISTDFTHFGQNYGYTPWSENIPEHIAAVDQQAFDFLTRKDAEGFFNFIQDSEVTIDGGSVVPVGLLLFPEAEVSRLSYTTSGEILEDGETSVSYAAFRFSEPADLSLSDAQKAALLDLAQKSLDSAVRGTDFRLPDPPDPRLSVRQGAFVTLEKDGELRGCIGHISPVTSLWQAVAQNAAAAALHDDRFSPVSADELESLSLEVSVLSVPEKMEGSPEERLARLAPGQDGLVLRQGTHSSTFLPQVWEQLPEKKEFLSHLSQKAGLSTAAWNDPETVWYRYRADHFTK